MYVYMLYRFNLATWFPFLKLPYQRPLPRGQLPFPRGGNLAALAFGKSVGTAGSTTCQPQQLQQSLTIVPAYTSSWNLPCIIYLYVYIYDMYVYIYMCVYIYMYIYRCVYIYMICVIMCVNGLLVISSPTR